MKTSTCKINVVDAIVHNIFAPELLSWVIYLRRYALWLYIKPLDWALLKKSIEVHKFYFEQELLTWKMERSFENNYCYIAPYFCTNKTESHLWLVQGTALQVHSSFHIPTILQLCKNVMIKIVLSWKRIAFSSGNGNLWLYLVLLAYDLNIIIRTFEPRQLEAL